MPVSRFLCALLAGVLLVLANMEPAAAAPPASCVKRFVGTWQITVLATGQRYRSVIRADGTTTADCPLCGGGTWTCNGRTFILTSPAPHTSTISADGRTITGGCCTAVRVGGAPVATAAAPAGGTGPQRAAAPSPQSKEWSVCSDGAPEPGIAACTTLIKTRMSGRKRLNDDDVGWAYGTRAFHYLNNSDPDRAMADVEQSMRMRAESKLTFAYYVRGLIFQRRNDHQRAIADFTKAVAINPKAGVAFAARAKSHVMLGDMKRADADYHSAGEATPAARARYEMEKELLVDWAQYLKEIQDAGDHANWSTPPFDAFRSALR
jgi:hypothetical protein